MTIVSIGWAAGRWKRKRYCLQTTSGPYTANCPIELSHGKSANFLVSFEATPTWASEFANKFLPPPEQRAIRTLRALVHTSVGTTVTVKPEASIVKLLREQIDGSQETPPK